MIYENTLFFNSDDVNIVCDKCSFTESSFPIEDINFKIEDINFKIEYK